VIRTTGCETYEMIVWEAVPKIYEPIALA